MSRLLFLLYHHFTLLILICALHVNGQIIFTNEPYTTTLLEESPIGVSILTVSAEDFDVTSLTGEYSIDSAEFVINSFNGTVSTNSVIDLEAHGSPLVYTFDVTYISDLGEFQIISGHFNIKYYERKIPQFFNYYMAFPNNFFKNVLSRL